MCVLEASWHHVLGSQFEVVTVSPKVLLFRGAEGVLPSFSCHPGCCDLPKAPQLRA